MAQNNENDFAAYLDQIIEATTDKRINWVKLNPTTYSWRNGPLQALIQQVKVAVSPPAASSIWYQFTANNTSMNPPRQEFSVTSLETPEILGKLKELFEIAFRTTQERGLQFLRENMP